MDCRVVLIFLLIAQAACGPLRSEAKTEAVSATIQLMRREIQTALSHLAEPGLLPNISCLSLNTTQLVGPEPFATHHLSTFRCHMLKMSKLTPELLPALVTTSQYSQDVQQLTSTQTDNQNCSLPAFEQDIDNYVYVKCLLEILDQRLSNATF